MHGVSYPGDCDFVLVQCGGEFGDGKRSSAGGDGYCACDVRDGDVLLECGPGGEHAAGDGCEWRGAAAV